MPTGSAQQERRADSLLCWWLVAGQARPTERQRTILRLAVSQRPAPILERSSVSLTGLVTDLTHLAHAVWARVIAADAGVKILPRSLDLFIICSLPFSKKWRCSRDSRCDSARDSAYAGKRDSFMRHIVTAGCQRPRARLVTGRLALARFGGRRFWLLAMVLANPRTIWPPVGNWLTGLELKPSAVAARALVVPIAKAEVPGTA